MRSEFEMFVRMVARCAVLGDEERASYDVVDDGDAAVFPVLVSARMGREVRTLRGSLTLIAEGERCARMVVSVPELGTLVDSTVENVLELDAAVRDDAGMSWVEFVPTSTVDVSLGEVVAWLNEYAQGQGEGNARVQLAFALLDELVSVDRARVPDGLVEGLLSVYADALEADR